MLEIQRLSTAQPDFWERLRALTAWDNSPEAHVEDAVTEILAEIKSRGDAALLEYTRRFDQLEAASVADLDISAERLQSALRDLPPEQRQALERAADRIRVYAERQKQESWSYTEADGTLLGQQVTPLDRVGVYVPGGKAAYPSSVLMNAIPAKVAGVAEVIMTVPTPRGEVNELVLA